MIRYFKLFLSYSFKFSYVFIYMYSYLNEGLSSKENTADFDSVVAHFDLDWEVLKPGYTKDSTNGTYCFSSCAGHNEFE